MSGFGKAASRHQAHIPATDYGKTHIILLATKPRDKSCRLPFFELSPRERSKLHESQDSCHPPVRSSYRWITGGRQRVTSGEESSDLAASKGLVSKPRSPINRSRGWLRHTCQSTRAASSRVKRLNERRIRTFIQSTRRL